MRANLSTGTNIYGCCIVGGVAVVGRKPLEEVSNLKTLSHFIFKVSI